MKQHNVFVDAMVRIIPVSLAISVTAAALGYWHTRQIAWDADIRFLQAEAQRALAEAAQAATLDQGRRLDLTARNMVRGTFAVAQAYSPAGEKVAEAVRPGFEALPAALTSLSHSPSSAASGGDSPTVMGMQTERIFTPIVAESGRSLGHLEGIRVVSEEERADYRRTAIESAVIGAIAVLLCAASLSPLLTSLAQRNYRWARSLLDAHLGMLEAFGRAIAKRDSDTGLHNYRVTWIAARIGEEVGLSSAALRNLIAGAFLHDIGKIGIPDAILLKRGSLTERERSIMQAHVELGTYIVGSVGFLGAREIIAGHHERWDGTGYPYRLAGEDIPLSARIFCIADVFDALRAKRPYKDSYSLEQAMEIMHSGRGGHFDPSLFDVFQRLVTEIESKVANAHEQQLVELMHAMMERHFFAAGAAADAEGLTAPLYCTDHQQPATGRLAGVNGAAPVSLAGKALFRD